MSEINKIIDKFFEEAAWTIMYDNRKCFADLKGKWVADLFLTNEYPYTSDIQGEYLKLFDGIDKLVYGKIDEKNSYVSYYKGNELFETDVNISDIIGKIKQSSNSGDMAESLKEEVKKRLLKKNGYRRIAQLYYYKKNHKWYEEDVEEAYREVIVEIIDGDEENCFIVTVCRKVESRTQEIVGCAIRASYDEISKNECIPREYVPSEEDYIAHINNSTPIYAHMSDDDSGCETPYYDAIMFVSRDSAFISIYKCEKDFETIIDNLANHKSLFGNQKRFDKLIVTSDKTYVRYFHNTFSYILGYDNKMMEDIINTRKSPKFIFYMISKDLNRILSMLIYMTNGNKTHYGEKTFSRFSIINNLTELLVVKAAIKIFDIMINSAIDNESVRNEIINRHVKREAISEIELIKETTIEQDLSQMFQEFYDNI